jgi:hypothetical protein
MRRLLSLLTFTLLLCGGPAVAQYTPSAAQNAPTVRVQAESRDERGRVVYREVEQKAAADAHGNARGNQFDLAVDGAFDGQTVAVLHFYTEGGFDFSLPRAALAEKGFSVYRWINAPPSPEELEKKLEQACQLWIISGDRQLLNDEHLAVIKRFFDSGRGVYIWGDNEPYYADANFVARGLLGVTMQGNVHGDKVVGLQKSKQGVGVRKGHLLTTGLEYLYEGITIATIQPSEQLEPLVRGSANNLVTAVYDRNGKRAILDGGFTRLYVKWDTAGTGRYVKNAAAWLTNHERFGDEVVAAAHKKTPAKR